MHSKSPRSHEALLFTYWYARLYIYIYVLTNDEEFTSSHCIASPYYMNILYTLYTGCLRWGLLVWYLAIKSYMPFEYGITLKFTLNQAIKGDMRSYIYLGIRWPFFADPFICRLKAIFTFHSFCIYYIHNTYCIFPCCQAIHGYI